MDNCFSRKNLRKNHELLSWSSTFQLWCILCLWGKGTVQVADGTALLDQVENLIDKVLDLKKQLE